MNYYQGKLDPKWAICLKSGQSLSRSWPKSLFIFTTIYYGFITSLLTNRNWGAFITIYSIYYSWCFEFVTIYSIYYGDILQMKATRPAKDAICKVIRLTKETQRQFALIKIQYPLQFAVIKKYGWQFAMKKILTAISLVN